MLDIHSHILPKMDDGSSVEESLKLLRTSAEQGITEIVATPHFYALQPAEVFGATGFLCRAAAGSFNAGFAACLSWRRGLLL